MKAQYVLQAIEVLKMAEDVVSHMHDPNYIGTLSGKATSARISLEIYSGIEDFNIPVENENE